MMHVAAAVKDAATKVGISGLALKLKRSPPIILLYHGVSRTSVSSGLRNFDGKHIPLDVFASHLRILHRSRKVISMAELVSGFYDGQDMSNTVVLTFDDGYENNASVAAPILADFKMPAAFFLATGYIGTKRCIWTDQLEKALDQTRSPNLELPGNEGVAAIGTLEEKHKALGRIKTILKTKPHQVLSDMVDRLVMQLKAGDMEAEGDYRFMSWQQAREMAQAGFEIGAHTVSHPILTKLSLAEATNEILASRDKVQEEVGQCSSTFCFPNGKLNDFNDDLKKVCAQHFKAALSTERGAAFSNEMFELRRLSPAGRGKGENMEWLLMRACWLFGSFLMPYLNQMSYYTDMAATDLLTKYS